MVIIRKKRGVSILSILASYLISMTGDNLTNDEVLGARWRAWRPLSGSGLAAGDHLITLPSEASRTERRPRMSAAQTYSDAMEALSRGRTEEGARGVTAALRSGLLPPHLVPDAAANLGTALSMLGRRAEAVVMYDASLVARPDSSLTLYNLGILRAEAGASAEAEQLYRRAM